MLCQTCGNDIAASSATCPHCGSTQTAAKAQAPSGRVNGILTINLKEGMPTVTQALARLDNELRRARRNRTGIVRIIHGYGSSGTGGKIKQGLIKKLATLRSLKTVRNVVAGDDYSNTTAKGRSLLARYPALKDDLRTDRNNPGITFVEL